MRRILWWDCSAGAAGDMLLASLIDAGAPLDAVSSAIAGLGLDVRLGVREVRRGAFRALHLQVEAPHEEHHHRPWRELRGLLATAALPERARQRALAVYGRLSAAEAHLHGIPVDDVELHEVGAADSIADVVGTCVALEALGVSEIVATPLPAGSGSIQGAHGAIPLPAPATLQVLCGWPVVPAPPGEWLTPTGAALVATLARPGSVPAMVVGRIGHGAGTRDPHDRANLVRALLGEPQQPGDVVELACNLDDMTPEHLAVAVDALLEGGAVDAWVVPIVMKKGRAAHELHALVTADDEDRLSNWILRNTTTLGVRCHPCSRRVLERWFEEVETPYGTVRIKVSGTNGEAWKKKPELEDVVRVARAAGVPLALVLAALPKT